MTGVSSQGPVVGVKEKIVLTIIFFLFFASPCFAQVEVNEETEFTFAKKAFSDGFYSLAQENIEDFLSKYPGTDHVYEAHLLLGRCFYYQNNLKKSSYEFDIVSNSPATLNFQDSALYWLGDIYYRSGDFKRALESYQKVIEGYPSSRYLSYAIYSKACAYYKLGFMEDAIATFSDVALRYPFEKIAVESQFRIGECEYMLGEYEKAENALKGFIEKYPLSEEVAQSHYLIGDINFTQGRFSDSINSLKRALSISPKAKWSMLALFRMAQDYLEIKDYDESIKTFENCLSGSKDPFIASNALLGLVNNYSRKGMTKEALKACDEVIANFPKSDAAVECYYIKAGILNGEGRLRDAEETSLKGIDKFVSPANTGKMHYELGRTFLKENKNKEALSEFRSAIKSLKDESLMVSAICEVGNIYLTDGNYAKAMESFDAVLRSYGDSQLADYAQYQVANLFFAAKKYDQSILAYQSILANFPKTVFREKVLFKLGVAYFNKKEFARAYEEFDILKKEFAEVADSGVYKFYLANSLYSINRYEDALELFLWLAKNASDKTIALRSLYQVGWCYYNMDKNMKAADAFSAFLKDHTDSEFSKDASEQCAAILLNAAQSFEKLKMTDDAQRLYKKLEELKNKEI